MDKLLEKSLKDATLVLGAATVAAPLGTFSIGERASELLSLCLLQAIMLVIAGRILMSLRSVFSGQHDEGAHNSGFEVILRSSPCEEQRARADERPCELRQSNALSTYHRLFQMGILCSGVLLVIASASVLVMCFGYIGEYPLELPVSVCAARLDHLEPSHRADSCYSLFLREIAVNGDRYNNLYARSELIRLGLMSPDQYYDGVFIDGRPWGRQKAGGQFGTKSSPQNNVDSNDGINPNR